MKTLSEEIHEAMNRSPADYVREERARIRRELVEWMEDAREDKAFVVEGRPAPHVASTK